VDCKRNGMWVLPVPLLVSLFVGLLSVIVLVWGLWAVYRLWRIWRDRRGMPGPCFNHKESRRLAVAGLVVLFSVAGRPVIMLVRGGSGADSPQHRRSAAGRYITAPDGTSLYVETAGRDDAPALVLTHGWGADADLWQYAKRDLANDYRIVAWDLPGLGNSQQPPDRNYSLDRMAEDLQVVVSATPGPVILVGHSIGGMINLTFGRRYPDLLGSKVRGIVEMNSTYTNPIRTTSGAGFAQALQKPVAEPILHAMIALSPLVRVMNALRYYNGMSHLQNALQSFAGTQTAGEVDFVSRYEVLSTPSVVARGGLAMFHWDASKVLDKIAVPVLLIAADRDTTTLPAASEDMNRRLPHSELYVTGPAKHMGVLERNREYNQAVRAFAKRCFAASVVSAGVPDSPGPRRSISFREDGLQEKTGMATNVFSGGKNGSKAQARPRDA
jgi:pimeloyl-ACP methyl ester carboxylesterase